MDKIKNIFFFASTFRKITVEGLVNQLIKKFWPKRHSNGILLVDRNGPKTVSLLKAASSVTYNLLILELMFLFFKNTVKKTKIQIYILPIS